MPTDIDPRLYAGMTERAASSQPTNGVSLAQGMTLGGLGGPASAINSAWSYTVGQCTAFAATVASWIPAGLGNAKDWVPNAKAKGFEVSSVPVVGSVVGWAGGGGMSEFGHVAVVDRVNADGSFVVEEQNFTLGPGRTDVRTVTSKSGIEGFILPPGGASIAIGAAVGGVIGSGVASGPDLSKLSSYLVRAVLVIMGVLILLIGIYFLFNGPQKTVVAIKEGARVAPLAA